MGREDELKEKQLQAAKELDSMGIDPDTVMVTFSPEEYDEMYGSDEPEYYLNENTINLFPISLLGSQLPLANYSLTPSVFECGGRMNIIEMYIIAVRRALEKAEEADYNEDQVESQIDIQAALGRIIATASDYYNAEYASDFEAYEMALNSIQKSELASDLRYTSSIIGRVDHTKLLNDNFTEYLRTLLYHLKRAR